MNIFGFENYIVKGPGGLSQKQKWTWKPARWDLIKSSKGLLKFNSKVEVFKADKFKNGYTLLLSRKNVMIGNMMNEMKKQNKPFVYVNWDEFIEEGVVYFDEAQNAYQLRYKKYAFDLKKVKAIYFDYFELVEVFHFKRDKFSNKEKVFLARWIEALKTLESVCSKATWYPAKPLDMTFEIQNKFSELLKAKKMGFTIPKMIYSNDPREVQKFLIDRKSILKESGLRFFHDKRNLKIYETKIVESSDKGLKHLHNTPCMFQEFIEKEYDLRVIAVGNKILTAKIESQKNDKAKGDWRGKEHLVPFKPYELPVALQKKVIKFMKEMNFQIATFDLIKGIDRKYYFLEMNRPGQWFFIEALAGIPITKTLIQQF